MDTFKRVYLQAAIVHLSTFSILVSYSNKTHDFYACTLCSADGSLRLE